MNRSIAAVCKRRSPSIFKKFAILTMLLLSFFASQGALAIPCTMANPGYRLVTSWPNPISVADTTPNGTVLATAIGTPDADYSLFVTASGSIFDDCYVGWYVTGATAAGGIWSTNVPGIGLRVSYGTSLVSSNGSQHLTWFGQQNFYRSRMTLELIKTGAVTSTSTLNAISYYFNCNTCGVGGGGGPGDTYGLYLGVNGTTVQPAAPTCSLSTNNATFDMGTLSTTAFTGGPGTHLPTNDGWVADQSLISAGCNASTVSMTFAGTAAAAPYSGQAFANAGTARGVALELWQKNGTQVTPNSSTPITFSPQGAGGRYTFSARYLQTEPTVTAGTVNARVTVTVNYK